MSFSDSPRACSAIARVACACACPCAPHAEVAEHRACAGDDRQHGACGRDLACADQRLARGDLARALRGEVAFGGVARLALQAQVAAALDHAARARRA